jgi:hypothetical protein
VTKKEFLTLQNSLLPELPGFVARGDIMYIAPATSLLRGIDFDSSGFRKEKFYVSSFIMPLCVPHQHLVLTFGDRLRIDGRLDDWSNGQPRLQTDLLGAIKTQALPLLERVKTLGEFVELIEPTCENSRSLEARGYALARLGRSVEAIQTFRALLNMPTTYQWEIDLAAQASSLLRVLESDPMQAKELVINVEKETRRNLKLPELVS